MIDQEWLQHVHVEREDGGNVKHPIGSLLWAQVQAYIHSYAHQL